MLRSHPSGDSTPTHGQGAAPSGNPGIGTGWADEDGDRGTASAKHPVGSLGAAEPNSHSRGRGAGARLPGTPHAGRPRGHGAPAVPVSFPQLLQGGFSGSRPGRRSRSPSLLCPAVLAAGDFPSLPFPDVTESPPKLTPTSLPRSRGSKPNVVLPSRALLPWKCGVSVGLQADGSLGGSRCGGISHGHEAFGDWESLPFPGMSPGSGSNSPKPAPTPDGFAGKPFYRRYQS